MGLSASKINVEVTLNEDGITTIIKTETLLEYMEALVSELWKTQNRLKAQYSVEEEKTVLQKEVEEQEREYDPEFRWLSTTNAAKYLGVSKTSLFLYMKKYENFPQPLLLGLNKYLFDRFELDKWIESRKEAS